MGNGGAGVYMGMICPCHGCCCGPCHSCCHHSCHSHCSCRPHCHCAVICGVVCIVVGAAATVVSAAAAAAACTPALPFPSPLVCVHLPSVVLTPLTPVNKGQSEVGQCIWTGQSMASMGVNVTSFLQAPQALLD